MLLQRKWHLLKDNLWLSLETEDLRCSWGNLLPLFKYNLPIRVIVIKCNTHGMIRWEQIAFLGNPEYGVEFTPIDYAKLTEVCGGKGYALREPAEVKTDNQKSIKREKTDIVEAYVDPFDLPMPPKVEAQFIRNLAESFAKGQPHSKVLDLLYLETRYTKP